MVEYGVMVSYPGKTDTLSVTNTSRDEAILIARRIDNDSTPATARVVWREVSDWMDV